MLLEPTTLLMLATTALGAGFLSAVAGSSGMIILPALLLAGVPPVMALGTNKLYTTTSLFSSAALFLQKKIFSWRCWLAAGITTLVGAVFGALLTQLVNAEIFAKILPILIGVVAIYFLLPQKTSVTHAKNSKPCKITSTALGGFLGIYSGFLGAGTGAFWTSFIMKLFKTDITTACAIARFMCFISNFAALITFMLLEQIDYSLGAILAALGAIGAYFGAKFAIKFGKDFIKPLLILSTSAMATKLAFTSWL